jgi:hypothetical protein
MTNNNTIKKTAGMEDRKVILSTLWIFAMFNYIYADILTFFEPGMLEELMTGSVGGIQFTQVFLLGAAVLMETAIAMVLLSRVLKYRANRWANIIVGAIHTASVFLSMFVGTPALFYMFFGTIEIVCTLFIIWYAWTWPNPEG